MPVDRNPPGSHVKETRHQRNQGALARATRSDQRENLSGFNLKLNVVQHLPLHAIELIAEGDVVKRYSLGERREDNRVRFFLYLVGGIHELEDLRRSP